MDEDEIDELLQSIDELETDVVGRELILELVNEVGAGDRAG